MTDDEALDRATAELELSAGQMTRVEYEEQVIDRARQLTGKLPLARLTHHGGARLDSVSLLELMRGIEFVLSDQFAVLQFGDARLMPKNEILVLYRLTERPDAALLIKRNWPPKAPINWFTVGKDVGVWVYDLMADPEKVRAAIARADARLKVAAKRK